VTQREPTDASDGYSATAWSAGPGPVYDRLADAVVDAAPVRLAGALVLDLGAGTGAASRAVMARQGRIVAVDLSGDMLAFRREQRPPATVADAGRLPLADDVVDVAVAAFSLTHVDPPLAGLAEAVRVTRPDGHVVASAFAHERHPAKDAVDRVLVVHGWTPPGWYAHFKRHVERQFAVPESLAAMGCAGGLVDVDVLHLAVETGLSSAEEIVGYRLGMAQFAPFVDSLDDTTRERLRLDAIAEIGALAAPMCAEILVLVGRVP
jgi:SAM-dependent methyltransferase